VITSLYGWTARPFRWMQRTGEQVWETSRQWRQRETPQDASLTAERHAQLLLQHFQEAINTLVAQVEALREPAERAEMTAKRYSAYSSASVSCSNRSKRGSGLQGVPHNLERLYATTPGGLPSATSSARSPASCPRSTSKEFSTEQPRHSALAELEQLVTALGAVCKLCSDP
jgi:hypothetical protein